MNAVADYTYIPVLRAGAEAFPSADDLADVVDTALISSALARPASEEDQFGGCLCAWFATW